MTEMLKLSFQECKPTDFYAKHSIGKDIIVLNMCVYVPNNRVSNYMRQN